MLKPLLFATIAAVGNALFVYGQRGSAPSPNAYLFMFSAVTVCTVLFGIAVAVARAPGDFGFVAANARFILISGAGFFVTFIGFYLLYSNYGATQYVLYAIISIMTTSIGVGVFIYRESFNAYQIAATVLAIAAIALFTYGQGKGGS